VEKSLKTYQNLSGFTVLGNLKTSLAGTYHAFNFGKYGTRYLAEVAYRFNQRFRLDILPQRLLFAAICCPPHTEAWLRWGGRMKKLANQENSYLLTYVELRLIYAKPIKP